MTKINFNHMKVQNLAKTQILEMDVRSRIAELVYAFPSGLAGHLLAHKINDTDGEVELSVEQITIIEQVLVHNTASPQFLDAVFPALGLSVAEVMQKYNGK